MKDKQETKPSYYSVIPASVRYDEKLSANAKLLYGEITSLSNEKGYCWATNHYFARIYNVSDRSVIRWIRDLEERNYIRIQMIYKEQSKEVDKRLIFINDPLFIKNRDFSGLDSYISPGDKNVTTPGDNNDISPGDKNVTTPGDNNDMDNNTSLNNTSLNNFSRIAKKPKQNNSNTGKEVSGRTISLHVTRWRKRYCIMG